MTLPVIESRAHELVLNSIAANEYFESSEGFRRRIKSMPGQGKNLHKPLIAPATLNKSRSVGDVSSMSQREESLDLLRQQSGKTVYFEEWVRLQGSYGLGMLFMDENEICDQETEEIIMERTKK